MMEQSIAELYENEWYVVRHSGEIPEIALHSALYFLTRDKIGPQLELTEVQLKGLQDAALSRFREIILRDILSENIGTSAYRGLSRCMANYQRYLKFCQRQSLEVGLREQVHRQLIVFLEEELRIVRGDYRSSSIDCSWNNFLEFYEQFFPNSPLSSAQITDISILFL
ncbi:unknown protein [Desulfotalea psychrophila LSv54]|uniref:Uncharacterized protein n=2 Tax=Desulfotalea psychrophila TaxID=84980 RepID=Q6AIM3_DESPS|nr:unknown protein [Desulfotalea psychrophila LSv54]